MLLTSARPAKLKGGHTGEVVALVFTFIYSASRPPLITLLFSTTKSIDMFPSKLVYVYCERLFARLRPHSRVGGLVRTLTTAVSLALSTAATPEERRPPFNCVSAQRPGLSLIVRHSCASPSTSMMQIDVSSTTVRLVEALIICR